MYNRKYRTNSNDDKNIFDDAGNLGNLAIKAYGKGGMPLVLVFFGIICLVITVFFVFINISKVWTVIFLIISLSSLISAIYFYRNQKKELCPKCNGNLIERNGPFGKFLGCSDYPKCNFTKKII